MGRGKLLGALITAFLLVAGPVAAADAEVDTAAAAHGDAAVDESGADASGEAEIALRVRIGGHEDTVPVDESVDSGDEGDIGDVGEGSDSNDAGTSADSGGDDTVANAGDGDGETGADTDDESNPSGQGGTDRRDVREIAQVTDDDATNNPFGSDDPHGGSPDDAGNPTVTTANHGDTDNLPTTGAGLSLAGLLLTGAGLVLRRRANG